MPQTSRSDRTPGAADAVRRLVAGNVKFRREFEGYDEAHATLWRRDPPLTQEGLAKRMAALGYHGWYRATVSEIERGRRSVTVDELAALALALGVTLTDLMDTRMAFLSVRDIGNPVTYEGGSLPHSYFDMWLDGALSIRATYDDNGQHTGFAFRKGPTYDSEIGRYPDEVRDEFETLFGADEVGGGE